MDRTLSKAKSQQDRRNQIVIPELEEADPRKYRPWTHKEEEVMREYYPRVEVDRLVEYLKKEFPPGRTKYAVTGKAYQLGITETKESESC